MVETYRLGLCLLTARSSNPNAWTSRLNIFMQEFTEYPQDAGFAASLALQELGDPMAVSESKPRPEFTDQGSTLNQLLLLSGTPGRTRTCDLLLRRQALYPLSYGRADHHSIPSRAGCKDRRARNARSRGHEGCLKEAGQPAR